MVAGVLAALAMTSVCVPHTVATPNVPAAALSGIVTLARDVSVQLSSGTANDALREVLKTTQVTQKRNRVIATATLSPALLNSVTTGQNSSSLPATSREQAASK